jgi:hypothetical protein
VRHRRLAGLYNKRTMKSLKISVVVMMFNLDLTISLSQPVNTGLFWFYTNKELKSKIESRIK